jgi:hypothetical protein
MIAGFTLEGVEHGIETAADTQDQRSNEGPSLLRGLKHQHVVRDWVFTQSSATVNRIMGVLGATEGNMDLLAGLWELCAKHGIVLTPQQKIELYQDFLDE